MDPDEIGIDESDRESVISHAIREDEFSDHEVLSHAESIVDEANVSLEINVSNEQDPESPISNDYNMAKYSSKHAPVVYSSITSETSDCRASRHYVLFCANLPAPHANSVIYCAYRHMEG